MSNFSKFRAGIASFMAVALAGSAAHATSGRFSLGVDTGTTAYAWYYESVYMWFGAADGWVPPDYVTDYLTFQGTAKSTNGHCLEITLLPTGSYQSASGVETHVNDHGTDVMVNDTLFSTGSYATTRLWVHATGSTPNLYWRVQFEAPTGSTNGDFWMDLRRIEVDKAQCTTGSSVPWISFEGSTASYTFTHGGY